jgi:hypothetical protein
MRGGRGEGGRRGKGGENGHVHHKSVAKGAALRVEEEARVGDELPRGVGGGGGRGGVKTHEEN